MTAPLVVAGAIRIPFRYAAGAAASRFLLEMRDHGRIMGTRCPRCRRVLVPARSFCPACWVETAEWVEVGPAGGLVTWTTVTIPLPHAPEEPPVTIGLVRLDGADTDFLHLVRDDERGLRPGLRMTPLWSERRSGSVRDLLCFVPATEGDEDGLLDDQG